MIPSSATSTTLFLCAVVLLTHILLALIGWLIRLFAAA